MQFDGVANNLFHPGQFGGIKKHATTDVALILTDHISQHRDRGLFTSVLAVDIAQFFPSMNHDVIFDMLTRLGFNHLLANLILHFLTDRRTTYRWGAHESGWFATNKGVPQGDCLSPVLSALYISLILRVFFPWDVENDVNSLFFVDDGTFFTSSTSMTTNASRLSRTYLTLSSFFAKIGITIEPSKVELMHFIAFNPTGPARRFLHKRQPPLTFTVNGQVHTILPKEVWRYLGFFFDSFLKFHFHVQFYINKSFSTIRACSMLGNSVRGLSPSNRVLAYNSVVFPVLSSGLPLWYAANGDGVKALLGRMNRVQAFALRWATGGMKGTPNGALEILSGVPLLFLRANLLLSGYVARIATLPHNHLLRNVWDLDSPSPQIRRRRARRRPRHLPSDNPVTRLSAHRNDITEHFDTFHAANRPGDRVQDLFSQRLLRHNTSHPKKSSEAFKAWLDDEFRPWLDHIVQSPATTLLYSDGGFWRKKRYGTAAFTAQRDTLFLDDDVSTCAAVSSFDAELQALLAALQWLDENWSPSHPQVYILVDNQAVLNAALDMDAHSSQAVSIRINLTLKAMLTGQSEASFHFSYCPSHVGIEGNERADHLANSLPLPIAPMPRILRQHFISHQRQQANQAWALKASSPSYRGRQWIPVKCKHKTFIPRIGNAARKNFFSHVNDDDMQRMTRFTYAITNHAPTGEHSARIFPDKPTDCIRCGDDVLQSRTHILTCCTYLSSFPNLTTLKRDREGAKSLAGFIKNNNTAFSFEDMPDDVP